MTEPSPVTQAAAVGAMVLALVAALLAGGPAAAPAPSAAAGPPKWAEAIETGADHVTPEDLAARVMRGDDVLIVDVRPADEFASGFRLPGSRNLSVPRLLGPEGEALLASRPGALVVLVSNGMTHPGQAWAELARRRRTDVRVLEDGLDGFRARVLTPPSLRGATTEAAARAAAPQWAAARAFFLGAPAPTAATTAATAPPAGRFASDPPRLESPTVVSAAWLARRGREVVILDARSPAAQFAAGHLPGARHVPIEAQRTVAAGVPEELKSPEELATLFGALGIDAETEVVACADDKLQDATHLVLALASVGHRRAAVLEGGIAAWKAEGLPVVADGAAGDLPPRAATTYVVRPAADLVRVTVDEVAKASRDGAPRIVDTRPADAFRGEVSTEARPGHIPGSVSRPFTDDVVKTAEGVLWRTKEDLAAGWSAAGVTGDAPVIVTCRTGHQASQAWFTLRWLLGVRDVRWYDGSWKEWAARPELPAATGAAAPAAR